MHRAISTLALTVSIAALLGCDAEPTADVERRLTTTPERATNTPDAVPAFADLDQDGDGFLSAAETQEVPELRDIFALADTDQDGQLSVAEFSQATLEGFRVSPDAAGGPLFASLDADGDGEISAEEAHAVRQLAERFHELDRDGSGGLDAEEYLAATAEGLAD